MGRPVKLTLQQVLEIKDNPNKKTNQQFATEFGVSIVTVIAARKGHRFGYRFH